MVLVVMSLLTVIPGAAPWWLMLYPVIGAGLALPVSLAVVSMTGMIALALVSQWLIRGEPELTILLQGVFGFTAIIVRRLSLAIGELHATREEVARLAVSEERLRFARDLHDVLGHSLSLIVLKSELAGRLLPTAPERARTEVNELEHVARESLRQVRVAVAGYRQPSLAEELSAARQVLAASGIACVIEGPTPDLPAPLERLAAWVIREGVTNVVRHSGARSCSIRVSLLPQTLSVTVADDGSPVGAPITNGSGSGLAGLRERAAAHGGTVSAGPVAGGGFELGVQVPLAGHSNSA
jgi:two-component system, NarL family, sensor histidine kinase DesK